MLRGIDPQEVRQFARFYLELYQQAGFSLARIPRVIGEIMAYSEKHGKQIVAFSPSLLSLGALMSVVADDGDVADQVIALLAKADDRQNMAGAAMTDLTQMKIEINPTAAQELKLIIPQTLALYVQDLER